MIGGAHEDFASRVFGIAMGEHDKPQPTAASAIVGDDKLRGKLIFDYAFERGSFFNSDQFEQLTAIIAALKGHIDRARVMGRRIRIAEALDDVCGQRTITYTIEIGDR